MSTNDLGQLTERQKWELMAIADAYDLGRFDARNGRPENPERVAVELRRYYRRGYQTTAEQYATVR